MINVILKRDKRCLGWDFYNWLFDDPIYNKIEDVENNVVLDNSILVVSTQNKNATPLFKDMIQKFDDLKFCLYVLAEETEGHDLSYCNKAKIVFMNFFQTNWANNIKWTTLGYPNKMQNKTGYFKKATDRKYIWSFCGGLRKGDRKDMVNKLSKFQPNFIHKTACFGGFEHPSVMGKDETIKIYQDSVFIPCPIGNRNIECYRLWEALEHGCIPVIKDYGWQSYKNMIPDHPFLIIGDWQDLNIEIDINKKQAEIACWHRDYMSRIKKDLKEDLSRVLA